MVDRLAGLEDQVVVRQRRARRYGGDFRPGSLALMAVVTFELGRSALVDAPTIVLAAASAVLLLRFEVNSAWLVVGGALLGLGISLLPDGISLSR